MRQYRGKRIDNGEWVYGMLMHKWACGTEWSKYLAIQLAEDGNSHLVHPDSVGLSTGKKDKNDKDIFQHDDIIISRSTGCCDQDEDRTYKAKVVWLERGLAWGIDFHDGNIGDFLCDEESEDIEIVTDTPALLDSKK